MKVILSAEVDRIFESLKKTNESLLAFTFVAITEILAKEEGDPHSDLFNRGFRVFDLNPIPGFTSTRVAAKVKFDTSESSIVSIVYATNEESQELTVITVITNEVEVRNKEASSPTQVGL